MGGDFSPELPFKNVAKVVSEYYIVERCGYTVASLHKIQLLHRHVSACSFVCVCLSYHCMAMAFNESILLMFETCRHQCCNEICSNVAPGMLSFESQWCEE